MTPIYRLIAVSFASFALTLSVAHGAGIRKNGDLTGDGTVDVRDAVLLLQNAAGMTPLSPEQAASADVNADGSIDVIDAVAILRASEAGEIPLPPSLSSSARFQVDMGTKQVKVLPLPTASDVSTKTKANGFGVKAVFAGRRISFNSSTIIDEPGDAGIKALQVSLKNNTGFTIGSLPNGAVTGVRLLFSDITTLTAPPDLRPNTDVTTLAGSATASCVDGPLSSATFNGLTGIVTGTDGTIYVADTLCNKVRRIRNGQVVTLAGSGAASSVDGAGALASFNAPRMIALNPKDGTLVVTDYGGNRIRRVTLAGEVTTIAGTGAAGGANSTGDKATFNAPLGVAVDSGGQIYVGEYGGHRIRRIALSNPNFGDPRLAANYLVFTLAGNGVAGYHDGIGTAIQQFSSPSGLAVDSAGVVYVADYFNNRVRRVEGGEVTTVAGTGAATSTDGPGDAATLNRPVGITLVNGAIAVTEFAGHKVRQLTLKPSDIPNPKDAGSWSVQTLAGTGAFSPFADGTGNVATFFNPYGITSDGDGDLIVADYNNHRIRKIASRNGYFPVGAPSPTSVTEPVRLSNPDGLTPPADRPFLRYAQALAPGETSAERKWGFIVPAGVTAFDFTVTVEAATDTLAPPTAVSNTGSTGAGSPDVIVRTLAGGQQGFADGQGTQARFGIPFGIAVDGGGNLYVTEFSNNSVRRVDADGSVTTVAGDVGVGTAGNADGVGTVARFDTPLGVAVTRDGKVLYVADSDNNKIRRIRLSGSDPKNASSWSVSTILNPSTATAGYVNGAGTVARVSRPIGVALSGDERTLYVTENNGQRVRRLQFKGGNADDPNQWQASLVAGSPLSPNGATGFADGVGSGAQFYYPTFLTVDPAGNLYVADSDNHRIRKITSPNAPAGGTVTAFAGPTGAPAPAYVDGPAPLARFQQPTGIAADSSGYLFVTDDGNYRIRRISPSGIVTTVAGNGSIGSVDGPGNVATLSSSYGVAVDGSGNVYFADGGNNSVRFIQRVLK